jgi:hypothetical protein
LLRRLARRRSTFAKYSGHLLLAFYFIATTSRDAALRRQALTAGRERARYWKRQWYRKRRRLDAVMVMDEICASYAAAQVGIPHRKIRRDLEAAAARYSPRELLGFDPRSGAIPQNVPEDCECGAGNEPGRRRCRQCRRSLTRRSRYEVWYYALINIYFCERFGLALPVGYADVMNLLPTLRPYPGPGSRYYRDAIYAVTHIVYTLNDYNRSRLPPPLLRRERAFLKAGMAWAIKRGDADTVAEIVDSLAGCGVHDADVQMMNGRAFILEQQREDGGWGDEDHEYGRFHSVWTCIDGLRDYAWRGRYLLGKTGPFFTVRSKNSSMRRQASRSTMSRRKKWISPG